MATVVTRHRVGNIDKWIKGQQDRLDLFGPAVSSLKAFQDTDDPNSVVLVLEVTNLELFHEILNDPKTQSAKDKHTVLEPIIVSMEIDF
ncbi:MAG: hypothetical protein C0591_14240 [Marinilabiliales bacterium]|jgi:hypothetical protein|nr:MAG: hypothetical protein C0591_14240 [Marinilabiliales bacterium]